MDGTAWVMMAHIITLGLWSASLLLLAGMYAVGPDETDRADVHRHGVMCRYAFVVLASPAAVLAIITGSALVALRGVDGSWLLAKLAVVALLGLFHCHCGTLLHKHGFESPRRNVVWRKPLLIAIPVLLISLIFVLVLAKPDVVLEYQLAPKPAGYSHQGSAQQGEVETATVDGSQRILQTG